jgi:DNA-binding transcriptional ArsR family regulator
MAVFDVLADASRRRILGLLLEAERPVGALVHELGMSQPAVSRHLKVLRDAELVESRVDAQRRLYRLRLDPLRELDTWLEPYRLLWSGRLDELERHLDEMEDE